MLLFAGKVTYRWNGEAVEAERPDCFRHEAYCLLASRGTRVELSPGGKVRPRPRPGEGRIDPKDRKRRRPRGGRGSQPGALPNVRSGLLRVEQRVSLLRVLFGFYQKPPLVPGVGEDLENRIKIHVPVPWDGERPVPHRLEEAPAVPPGLLHHGEAHILQMHVADTVHVRGRWIRRS